MSEKTGAWRELREHLTGLDTLRSVQELIEWDEQTMMPRRGARTRGAQLAQLAGIVHERATDPRIEGWLAAIEGDEDPAVAACHRNLSRDYRRDRRVPAALVDQLAVAKSEGFTAWMEAREGAGWAHFAPKLERLVALTRERAAAIDDGRPAYDVLLEEFDPGTTTEALSPMFQRLRDGLAPLLDAIAGRPQLPAFDHRVPEEIQKALHEEVAAALGYDFAGGRLDHSEHPFSVGVGEGDVRITTHIKEDDFLQGLGSTIHEAGHALYEQGLPHQLSGTTANHAASFGLHESQSRFWENFIGRSLPFSRWLEGRMKERFGDSVTISADDLYRGANRVERGLIRVKADEVTYNLHVIVRFELEQAIFAGELAVADLPAAWNAKYEETLGVAPPNDKLGVMQDVHWSGAAFGYFPSYTLGNLYGASLSKVLEADLATLWSDVERGEFGGVLAWLRERVHDKGHLLEAPEIVRAAVGDRDHVEDLLDRLWERQGALYGVSRA